MNWLTTCFATVLSLGVPLAASAQGRPTPTSAGDLESADWTKRAAAYSSLKQRPSGASATLLRLLERENAVVVSTLRASEGKSGVSDKYGEGFGEYYSDLLNTCLRYCDKQRVLNLLMTNEQSGISEVRNDALRMLGQLSRPERGFTVSQRGSMHKTLAAAAGDMNSFIIREVALQSIRAVVQGDRTLNRDAQRMLHEATVARAGDSFPDVRRAAVQALGEFKDTADVALLRRLAETDTSKAVNRGATRFPVRDEARRAIARIRSP